MRHTHEICKTIYGCRDAHPPRPTPPRAPGSSAESAAQAAKGPRGHLWKPEPLLASGHHRHSPALHVCPPCVQPAEQRNPTYPLTAPLPITAPPPTFTTPFPLQLRFPSTPSDP
eukprot:5017875-Prymnesium_polylepis.1